jgi:hypothetical protein
VVEVGAEHDPDLTYTFDPVLVTDRGVVALRPHQARDLLVEDDGNRDEEPAALHPARRGLRTERIADDRVGHRRAVAPGDPPAVRVVDGEPPAAVGQLDRIPGRAADVDLARRGDRVSLQAQEALVAVGALQHERQWHGEQHDGHRGDAGDREHEAASHPTSRR